MGNDLLKKKFDDLDRKVDCMIAECRSLQVENHELKSKLEQLEMTLDKTHDSEKNCSGQEAVIQSKINGLLGKLDEFSRR